MELGYRYANDPTRERERDFYKDGWRERGTPFFHALNLSTSFLSSSSVKLGEEACQTSLQDRVEMVRVGETTHKTMMVFGERRMKAGVQPLNIQPMPSCLNECAMTDEIDAWPEAFMICRVVIFRVKCR